MQQYVVRNFKITRIKCQCFKKFFHISEKLRSDDSKGLAWITVRVVSVGCHGNLGILVSLGHVVLLYTKQAVSH